MTIQVTKIQKLTNKRNRFRDAMKALAGIKPTGQKKFDRKVDKLSLRAKHQRRKANKDLQAARKAGTKAGPMVAVNYAVSQIGVKESPPGSNRGPVVDMYIRNCLGYTTDAPWCGCFVHEATSRAGVKFLHPGRIAYTPYIVQDGDRNVNGLRSVRNISAVKPGDWAVFNFGSGGAKHVGIVTAINLAKGEVTCIEGNTSPGLKGSQNNGEGVYRRYRPVGHVLRFVRPVYPKA